MTLNFFLVGMLTGELLSPLPISKGTWKVTTNADESLSCTVLAHDPDARRFKVWEAATLASTGLLAVVDGQPVAAGPLWKRSYDADKGTIKLSGAGLRSYWKRRVLVDPRDTSLDIRTTGVDLGTIAKRYIELGRLWPGGSIPMVFAPDREGSREREVAAVDLKIIDKLVTDLTNVDSGPDVAFRPEWNATRTGIVWRMETGTEDTPRLGNTDAAGAKWTYGGQSGATSLKIDEDATGLASTAWAVGDETEESTLITRSTSRILPDAGFPLLEVVDVEHDDVSELATLQAYADQRTYLGQFPASFWGMTVRARERGNPRLGDYWLGDLATITITKDEPVIPAGDYQRRIAAISGNEKDEVYELVFAEAMA